MRRMGILDFDEIEASVYNELAPVKIDDDM